MGIGTHSPLNIQVTIDRNRATVNGHPVTAHPGLSLRDSALRTVALRTAQVTGRPVAVTVTEAGMTSQVVVHPGGAVTPVTDPGPPPGSVGTPASGPPLRAVRARSARPRPVRRARPRIAPRVLGLVAGALAGFGVLAVGAAQMSSPGQPPSGSPGSQGSPDSLTPVSFAVVPASHLARQQQRLGVRPAAGIEEARFEVRVAWAPATATVLVVDAAGAEHRLRISMPARQRTVRITGLAAGPARWTVTAGAAVQSGRMQVGAAIAATVPVSAPTTPAAPAAPTANAGSNAGSNAGGQGSGNPGHQPADQPPSGPVAVHDTPAPGPS